MPLPQGKTDLRTLRDTLSVLTFDLYGTVVDMQAGLTEAVSPYLQAKGWPGRPDSLVTWWRRTHFENSMIDALLDRGHTPYREIGRRALTLTLERVRHSAQPGRGQTPGRADRKVATVRRCRRRARPAA